MNIREATEADFAAIWPIFHEVAAAVETYACIKSNQSGPGSHVCNSGYRVSSQARGEDLATRMCLHSQETALAQGYLAMQFKLVAASNEGAVRLLGKLGFATLGR